MIDVTFDGADGVAAGIVDPIAHCCALATV